MSHQDELAALRQRLDEAGLGRVAEELSRLARPGIRLIPDPSASVRSRIRGEPDLPSGVEWPVTDEVPLSFIAQIDLAEADAVTVEPALPGGGVLSFFYDAVNQPWGFDPAGAGTSAVLFTPADVETSPRERPPGLADEGVFPVVPLAAQVELYLPAWDPCRATCSSSASW